MTYTKLSFERQRRGGGKEGGGDNGRRERQREIEIHMIFTGRLG